MFRLPQRSERPDAGNEIRAAGHRRRSAGAGARGTRVDRHRDPRHRQREAGSVAAGQVHLVRRRHRRPRRVGSILWRRVRMDLPGGRDRRAPLHADPQPRPQHRRAAGPPARRRRHARRALDRADVGGRSGPCGQLRRGAGRQGAGAARPLRGARHACAVPRQRGRAVRRAQFRNGRPAGRAAGPGQFRLGRSLRPRRGEGRRVLPRPRGLRRQPDERRARNHAPGAGVGRDSAGGDRGDAEGVHRHRLAGLRRGRGRRRDVGEGRRGGRPGAGGAQTGPAAGSRRHHRRSARRHRRHRQRQEGRRNGDPRLRGTPATASAPAREPAK